jgi:hypothetical protein
MPAPALCYGGGVADSSDSLPGATAFEADRDFATRSLIQACSQGRLTLADFERRVEAVVAATTQRDLEQATRGLPTLAPAGPALGPALEGCQRRWSLSIVGGMRRRGGWQLPKHLIHISLIGGASIDLGDAELSGGETTITMVSIIGGADVRLPKAVRSELSGFSVFGGRHITGSPHALKQGPLVHLRAFSLVGGATIRPSGSRWRRFALTR